MSIVNNNIWYKESTTSSGEYSVLMKVECLNYNERSMDSTAYITLYLRRNNTDIKYTRRTWTRKILADTYSGGYLNTCSLPDDLAAEGVEENGYLNMYVNQWYQWGDTYSIKLANNGQQHIIYARMWCSDLYCPSEGEYAFISICKSFPKYNPHIPDNLPEPRGVRCVWDASRRALSYTWDEAYCSGVTLYRELYNKEGNVVASGYLTRPGRGENYENWLYNTDRPIIEYNIPESVCKVRFQVCNCTLSGSFISSAVVEMDLPPAGRSWVKVNGVWKKAIPWVKVNGVWKKAIPWVKVNGVWKRTT